jgi:hypothetical protein
MKKRKSLTLIILLFCGAIIFVYAFLNSRIFIAGPQIIIESPENGLVFSDPLIEIVGKAINTSFIKLNNNQIYVDENGIFKEKLLLPPGISIISLTASDRFNRTTEKTLWYTYRDNNENLIYEAIKKQESLASSTKEELSTSTISDLLY